MEGYAEVKRDFVNSSYPFSSDLRCVNLKTRKDSFFKFEVHYMLDQTGKSDPDIEEYKPNCGLSR